MAIGKETITKLKTDYEAKVDKLPKSARPAARAVWNRVIDAALAALAVQLANLKSLKTKDKVALALASGAVAKLTAKASSYAKQVQLPTKKVLAPSSSPETAELAKTLDSINSSNVASQNVALNLQGRAEASASSLDKKIGDLELNIGSLNRLKL